jgi:NTE family protein
MLRANVLGFSRPPRPISLALQGGGAHGAFTWGALDALLERTGHPIAAICGTSAGAVNAVVLAHGLLAGGRDGAREALSAFWQALGAAVPWDALGLVAGNGERFSTAGRMLLRWTQALMPAPANPLRIDPLRELLKQHVDFERLCQADAPRLYVAATNANTGRLRVFGNRELSLDAVLASACLPALQPAVQIDGEPYWDGGYSANPALYPLVHEGGGDVVLVLLSSWQWGATPGTSDEVRLRAADIAFNAAFLREMHWLADATALARRAWWPGALERRLRRVRWHMIDGHDALSALPADSKVIAHPLSLTRLRDAGRARAMQWIEQHAEHLGRRDSVDLQRVFGEQGSAPSDS